MSRSDRLLCNRRLDLFRRKRLNRCEHDKSLILGGTYKLHILSARKSKERVANAGVTMFACHIFYVETVLMAHKILLCTGNANVSERIGERQSTEEGTTCTISNVFAAGYL